MATDYGAFNCTNAALYVAGSIDGGVNISDPSDAHSATLVGLPDGGTSLGKLDLRGTEVHLGASDPTTITTTQVASTFSALPADSVITDENTSFIFNGTVTDFFRSSLTAGRNLGSLYFRPATATEAAVLDTTGQDPSTTEDIKSALMALVDNNITLHGNLEVANQEDASLNLLAFGKGTITVNGYVDLGNTVHHIVAPGFNLVFNGAIRG